MSFTDSALKMASMGVPVIPIPRGTKLPILKLWPQLATTNKAMIRDWGRTYGEDSNYGCVGKLLDGFCFFDCDDPESQAIVELHIGPFPQTFTALSGGRKLPHFYFRKTPAVYELGRNMTVWAPDGRKLGEFRAFNQQVVGPGSVHESGGVYGIAVDAPIADCPDAFVEFMIRYQPVKISEPAEPGERGSIEPAHATEMLDAYGMDYTEISADGFEGMWDIVCPWEEEHTTDPAFGDTVLTVKDGLLGFGCKHGHCQGIRNVHDFRDEIDPERVLYKFPVEDDDNSDFAEDVSELEVIEPREVKQGEIPRVDKDGNLYVEIGETGTERVKLRPNEHDEAPQPSLTAVEEGKVELLLAKKGGTTVQVVATNAASIRPEELTWLWENRIPDGAITWFVGKPGQGKSMASISVVATVTTGRNWCDGATNTAGPRRVLMYCAEDSLSRIVVPRLLAAGADLDMIQLLDNKSFRTFSKNGTKVKRCIAMDEDMQALTTLLGKNPDIAMIVCDPITGIWGEKNVNHDKEIRPVLNNLMELCEKHNLTFLGVAHTNKRGNDADAIDKIQGGSSMAGAARAAFLFSRDPDSDDRHDHVMTNVKVNYTDEWNGLKFRTVGAVA